MLTCPTEASFRDPSGFVFQWNGAVHRQVNRGYQRHFARLLDSGLYDELTERQLLVRHVVAEEAPRTADGWQVIRPEPIEFISYPYEWCFGQLRSAAVATLEIQQRALARGLTLKDSSAFNIQFRGGRPLLIDTLSFEEYQEGRPWVAYRQFCQHFLGPLALMSYADVRLSRLSALHLDGIPLGLVARLLPWRTLFRPGLALHLHAHARADRWSAARAGARPPADGAFSRRAMRGLIASLRTCVEHLPVPRPPSVWQAYYQQTNYTADALRHKEALVEHCLQQIRPRTVWDLGSNTGRFSRLAARYAATVVAGDADHGTVEQTFTAAAQSPDQRLLPLWLDLCNPSPDLGWAHRERMSLARRGPADLTLALALVHHLAIGNNLPFAHIARFFRDVSRYLLIEFVPKHDTQVQGMLRTREDVFPDYDREHFERAFGECFEIAAVLPIRGTERTLYRMRAR